MDSTVITRSRTAAATAVAVKYLARPDSTVVTICGYGVQARAHLESMQRVLPLKRAFVFGRDGDAVRCFAADASTALDLEVIPATRLAGALRQSDVCITCTPANRYYVRREDVPPGMLIAAVGADSPQKQELDPMLLAENRVVADLIDQCAAVGELQHALGLGLLRVENVHADLGQVITGVRPGRTGPDEIIIFDSTGTAYQDAAASSAAYHRALAVGVGTFFDFFAA